MLLLSGSVPGDRSLDSVIFCKYFLLVAVVIFIIFFKYLFFFQTLELFFVQGVQFRYNVLRERVIALQRR
jgi:hypothetical protein